MSRIMLDANAAKQLNNIQGPAENCYLNGAKSLGRFTPKIDLSEWEPMSPGISEEELQRRMTSNERRYTTAEVLAYLEVAMMRVDWQETVLNELADIWTGADSSLRSVINATVQEIHLALGSDPFNTGESRLGAVRLAFFPPLSVDFPCGTTTATWSQSFMSAFTNHVGGVE